MSKISAINNGRRRRVGNTPGPGIEFFLYMLNSTWHFVMKFCICIYEVYSALGLLFYFVLFLLSLSDFGIRMMVAHEILVSQKELRDALFFSPGRDYVELELVF